MKQFEKIKINPPKRSVFNLSHERKYDCNIGELIPCFMHEVIPGDKFQIKTEHLVRFQPMMAPVMHLFDVKTEFFFVPYRLIWADFEKFITGGKDGDDATPMPIITGNLQDYFNNLEVGDLADYLGIPVDSFPNVAQPGPDISQLPFRAYHQIYNDYYVDQNVGTKITLLTDNGFYDVGDWVIDEYNLIRKRCWEKDYFTSALPTAQRGDVVSLPLGDVAPLVDKSSQLWNRAGGGLAAGAATFVAGVLGDGTDAAVLSENAFEADLSDATASAVTTVRTAFALQRWMEKMMRGGYRYIEQNLTIFGVESRDSRLQRAELLGGFKQPVIISEVLQTSETSVNYPLGELGGHGYSSGKGRIKRRFTEHGIVMGIMSIVPRTAYQQGIPRYFLKSDKFDFYWPDFAHIGEQEVMNQELYIDNTEAANIDTFGYQPRYSEYRYIPSTVHGHFRDELDYFHYGRIFSSAPSLNQEFTEINTDGRIFADIDEHGQIMVHTYNDFKAIRPISKFGNPY